MSRSLGTSRSRAAWWLLAAALALSLAFVAWAFVGTFVLGLFVYYASRPVARRLTRYTPSGVAAGAALFVFALPVLVLVTVLVAIGLQELAVAEDLPLEPLMGMLEPYVEWSSTRNPRELVASLLRRPNAGGVRQVLTTGVGFLGVVANGLFQVVLAIAFAFFLLRDGAALAEWFRGHVGESGGVEAYLSGVDADLKTVYFGNVLTVLAVAVLAAIAYNAFNLLAPGAVAIPLPTLLGIATGFATFVPLVVGKLVYVPIALYLGWQALRTDPSLLVYPVGFLAVALLVLDALPVMGLRPYLSGRTIHGGLMMFGYVLGTVLFGWYGLFLGPLLVVVLVRFARDVAPDLVREEPVRPDRETSFVAGDDADESEPDSR